MRERVRRSFRNTRNRELGGRQDAAPQLGWSMPFITRLIERFRVPAYRHSYAASFLDSYIATQIKVLRERRDLTQAQLAELAGMRQSQISRLEHVDHAAWKVSTLQKLARAFDLMLVVRFESFGRLVQDADQFGRAALERSSFDEDPSFSDVGDPVRELEGRKQERSRAQQMATKRTDLA